ncbi:hypothetical protein ACFO3K_12870 [Cellulomonas algicola]|uniref:Uncharacterized protein n=1 Tax=Cellulomonas algicola TaxID=2071633 RepID=A0A401UYX6_9CELL|nr:hypothetical protein [Cellulomonas algicola]GCD19815.1 hypothetical protein CTKZ_13770 [Cellulomonas algicola]
MPSAILPEGGTYRVVMVDQPRIWWEVVPESSVVAQVADRAVAERVARLMESVEDAVVGLVVNGPARLELLGDVARGSAPLAVLDVARELDLLHVPRDVDEDDAYPFLVDDLPLGPDDQEELRTAARRLVARICDQARQPGARLALLRVAGEVLHRRAADEPVDAEDPVVFRPDLLEWRLECRRCLCDFVVVPVEQPGSGPDPFTPPVAFTVEWHDAGVAVSEYLDEDDDCACHGEDVMLPWDAPAADVSQGGAQA